VHARTPTQGPAVLDNFRADRLLPRCIWGTLKGGHARRASNMSPRRCGQSATLTLKSVKSPPRSSAPRAGTPERTARPAANCATGAMPASPRCSARPVARKAFEDCARKWYGRHPRSIAPRGTYIAEIHTAVGVRLHPGADPAGSGSVQYASVCRATAAAIAATARPTDEGAAKKICTPAWPFHTRVENSNRGSAAPYAICEMKSRILTWLSSARSIARPRNASMPSSRGHRDRVPVL